MNITIMLTAARIVSLAIGFMGSVLLVSPKTMRELVAFWSAGDRIYLAGLLRVLIGTVLLSVRGCRWPLLVNPVGLLIMIGGTFIFVVGSHRIKLWLSWWEKRPELVIRLLGLFTLSLGSLLYYAVGFGTR
ncbi:MAG: hypothetical protein FJZ09_06420 [Candidatus Omnitrophica bacterium]|nr:hypothetical protein [Candidatus Omnitrophota bacterium]